ncbi:putative ribosomal protein 50S-L18Ae/60S-L20/60S-L18A [Rosa chinensis]|uniref:Putative ribosomal protein 50S-L18Ae/60S-L20/60S-L18A n=1 Tax=Rosa chinensis TaxID=74649 RepID=A0A2P6SH32_ROSCH|nr:60S ribosomal protein L18a isoform X1 [Rosa chinensis]PRQ57998.1 putative ribosomal protein 50S-L18Ae/60S-L20/60S-L18A [Rosa chinensis]
MVALKFHQYQMVGRALPKDAEDTPKIFRMKLWHTNDVRAKSKFWYFLKKVKVKKSNGQIVAINEVQSGKASEKLLFTYFPFLGRVVQ